MSIFKIKSRLPETKFITHMLAMHQPATTDDNSAGWDLVSEWFSKGDDDDPTLEIELPKEYCKNCKKKMKRLDTGFVNEIYYCPLCEK
jgi:hypothetical protein